MLVAASAAAAASPANEVTSVVLRPSQIGAGYKVRHPAGWNRVANQVTLDLCGYTFMSERQRVARRQPWFVHGAVQVSNEVVAYRAGGAAEALRELRAATAGCPKGFVPSSVQGVGALRNQLIALPKRALPPHALGFVDYVTDELPSGRQASIVELFVYQVRGNVLSGVYGLGLANESIVLRAAAQSAKNLSTL
jgi:hypothetical protein